MTLGIYARVMRRSKGDREALRMLVDGVTSDGSTIGMNEPVSVPG